MERPSMDSLTRAPNVVLARIIFYLDFDDTCSLGKTCRFFQYLHREESTCKLIIESKIPFSHEAQSASRAKGSYASAVRRAGKRRDALATANPFIVAIVGFGDTFLYSKGVLCCALDDRIRVLDLHNPGQCEAIISIPALLKHALPEINDDDRKGVLRILYYADNIISCLYQSSSSHPIACLVAFCNESKRILVTEELTSTDRIFIRHNKYYLYYGTHSHVGADHYMRWVVHGFDFERRKWFPQKVYLDLAGSAIGSKICFEFHQGYFYAVSNKTSFEVEDIEWTSLYRCVRFPLNCPTKDLCEDSTIWRRDHTEGPTDDRWTILRLDEDEITGDLRIVELRREWYRGGRPSQLIHYTTQILFCKVAQTEDEPLPDHPDDSPHHWRRPPRLPQDTHPIESIFKPTSKPHAVHSYFPSAGTYLHLLNDPDPADWQGTQRLRLCARSRKRGPPLRYENGDRLGLLRPPDPDHIVAQKEMYREQPIAYWPPEAQDLKTSDHELEKLHSLLNPPSHLGNVEGTADDRSLVYATGGSDNPRALVFMGFDPAMRLSGLETWQGIGDRCLDVIGTCTPRTEAKGKEKYSPEVSTELNTKAGGGYAQEWEEPHKRDLAWTERSMYTDIGIGFQFGLPRL